MTSKEVKSPDGPASPDDGGSSPAVGVPVLPSTPTVIAPPSIASTTIVSPVVIGSPQVNLVDQKPVPPEPPEAWSRFDKFLPRASAVYVAAALATAGVSHVAYIVRTAISDGWDVFSKLTVPIVAALEVIDAHWKGALLLVAPLFFKLGRDLLPSVLRYIENRLGKPDPAADLPKHLGAPQLPPKRNDDGKL